MIINTEDVYKNKLFQVSTLQALAMGYSRGVIPVGELLAHGDTGLGTYEDVNGEMILVDGHPYRADDTGCISEMDESVGVPFCAVTWQVWGSPSGHRARTPSST